MKTQVIKALNEEHFKAVVKYWESKGGQIVEQFTEWEHYQYIGIDLENDIVGWKSISYETFKEIELPEELTQVWTDGKKRTITTLRDTGEFYLETPVEKPFPKWMMVWDRETISKHKHFVLGEVNELYVVLETDGVNIKEITHHSLGEVTFYTFAEDIPDKIQVTKKEIAEWQGVDEDLIDIV